LCFACAYWLCAEQKFKGEKGLNAEEVQIYPFDLVD
jgi:hypothetical protein